MLNVSMNSLCYISSIKGVIGIMIERGLIKCLNIKRVMKIISESTPLKCQILTEYPSELSTMKLLYSS